MIGIPSGWELLAAKAYGRGGWCMAARFRLFIMLEQVNCSVKKPTGDQYADVHCVHDWQVAE